jgi:hypothetical protein
MAAVADLPALTEPIALALVAAAAEVDEPAAAFAAAVAADAVAELRASGVDPAGIEEDAVRLVGALITAPDPEMLVEGARRVAAAGGAVNTWVSMWGLDALAVADDAARALAAIGPGSLFGPWAAHLNLIRGSVNETAAAHLLQRAVAIRSAVA